MRIPARLGSLVKQRKSYFKLETWPLYHKKGDIFDLLDLDLTVSLRIGTALLVETYERAGLRGFRNGSTRSADSLPILCMGLTCSLPSNPIVVPPGLVI